MEEHGTKSKFALYFRNFIFGVEDSLVSTVGLLSGIAIADVDRATIFLSGMVLIFVEGFSMGVGSFLSEQSSEGYIHRVEKSSRRTIIAAIIMFISYFCAGFIPLSPYIIFPVSTAFWTSIGASLLTLFILGAVAARVSKISLLHSALRMFLIGGIAIALGVVVGAIVNSQAPIA